jgi:hypothetical protein
MPNIVGYSTYTTSDYFSYNVAAIESFVTF